MTKPRQEGDSDEPPSQGVVRWLPFLVALAGFIVGGRVRGLTWMSIGVMVGAIAASGLALHLAATVRVPLFGTPLDRRVEQRAGPAARTTSAALTGVVIASGAVAFYVLVAGPREHDPIDERECARLRAALHDLEAAGVSESDGSGDFVEQFELFRAEHERLSDQLRSERCP